ncbi:NAD-dependent epimerase/dehydratase family protein [Pinirhizobacter soli]|uniref:NAD-dependent epimerase/dehydratase family protein n=1 Tax=Pinirhizobacter soli TaxID=2786953 RepID=UPI00202A942C|nr:NAD-dependent epimerase/dehydratase family protein [Pinirhizobacter soli]
MKVAVTGATGFLGRYVLAELARRDVSVVAASRTAPSKPVHGRDVAFVQLDTATTEGAFERLGSPDVLIHLAWEGLPNYQSERHVKVEFPAQQRFLDECIKDGLSNLVVAGTCFEYGMAEGELAESLQAEPLTQYGLAKDMLRRHLEASCDRRGARLVWGRLFYLYGQGQGPASLYSLLNQAIDQGRPSFDMSGGAQVRDFLPAQEAGRLLVELALSPTAKGVVNICSGIPVTVRDLVDRWIHERQATISMNLGKLPYSPIEPMSFWGSRQRLETCLGARAFSPFAETRSGSGFEH